MGKLWAALLLFLALTVSGCRIVSTEGGEQQAVEYTVLRGEALPPEVERLIREQEGQAFQMTYKSGGYLYIPRGYGEQKSGGYSIQVEEVSVSDSALHFRTRLIGPATREEQKGESSLPWLVVKTEDPGLPVVFER